jgi:putative membrane-bound dehydrogenase-like protein
MTLIFALLSALQEQAGPLEPREALRSFRLPEGFRIELVAAEPDVADPVAMAFDADGRIYVAEMADYPLGPPSGRIRLLEDRDGDGRVDRSTLFARDIPYPTGVMPWRDGVLVTAAPDILWLRDSDGDGKAEIREVVFSGFREGNQQHRVNGLVFGIDNRIHGTNGDSGGVIRRGDGKPVPIHGRDFRFRPDYGGFEPDSGHGQYGNTFDAWGNRFICDNSNHARHPVLPLAALGRNPDWSVPAVEEGISDHGASCRIFAASKLQERPNDHFAANHFTSACSATVYTGGAWGPDFDGDLFVCEPVHNLVHRDRLVPKGASFSAKAAYDGREFLASTDPWSRPVNLCVGPDGDLYLVDMYRAVIEHPQWIPLEMQKRVDLRAGQDRGRLYRIRRDEERPAPRPRLSTASTSECIAHLGSRNAWWRLTAQRLLIERQPADAEEGLRGLLRSEAPLTRLHAYRALEGLGRLQAAEIGQAARDPEARIRECSLQWSSRHATEAAGDPDPRVRFRAALALGEVDDREAAVRALTSIVARDGADRWTRWAAWSSLRGEEARLLAGLAGTVDSTDLYRELAGIAGASRDPARHAAWIRAVVAGAETRPSRWRLIALSSLASALRRAGRSLDAAVAAAGAGPVLEGWTRDLFAAARDAGRDAAERIAAVELLPHLPGTAFREEFEKLLSPAESREIQVAAARALAASGEEALLAKLLDGWERYTGPVRKEVLAGCFRTPALMLLVLDRLEKGSVRPVELEAHHRDQLSKHPSGGVRERVRKALLGKGSEEIDRLVEETYAKVAAKTPDRLAGEKVYFRQCATCHRLHGQGHDVGPNLASVAGRDKKALLTDLLNPNRAVAPQYQVYVIKTQAQALVSGLVSAETPSGVTLRRANGEETTVLRRDILEMKAWPASMMPEGLENAVTVQEFADLLDFLQRGGK